MERRKFRRVVFREPVQYQLRSPDTFSGCVANDLSENGIRLSLNDFVPIQSELSLQVNLSTQRTLDCLGRVVWVIQIPFSDRYQIGIEFSNTESTFNSRKELHRFVEAFA